MKNRTAVALLIAVTLGTGLAQVESKSNQPVKIVPGDGQWWMSLSDTAKDSFVAGYRIAMLRASTTLGNECAVDIENLKLPPQKPDLKSAMKLCSVGALFDFEFEERDLRGGVDEFYKDSQNAHVPIDIALQHVRDTLKAKRPPSGGIGSR